MRPPAPTAASQPPGAPRGPNERFYSVQSKLDPGGSFYIYIDIKDKLKSLADDVREAVPGLGLPPMVVGIAMAVLTEIERTGLYGLEDIGASTIDEGEMKLNKLFLSVPDGRTGLLALLGGEAHEIDALAYAPDDTLVFSTLEYDVAGLLEYVRAAMRNVGGEAALAQFNQQLAMAGAQAGVNPDALIRSLAGRFTVVARLDAAHRLSIPAPQPMQIDSPQLAIIFDTRDHSLYDAAKSVLTSQGAPVTETEAGGMRRLAIGIPPIAGWDAAPILAADDTHLYVATHGDYLDKVLAAKAAGGGLARSEEFQRMSRGIPLRGNHATFVSDQVPATMRRIMDQGMSTVSGQEAAAQRMLMDRFSAKLGSFSIGVNQPDGILVVSRSEQAAGAAVAVLAAAPVVAVLAAIAVPNFLEAQTRAKVSRVRSDLRTMATAIESYYVDYVTYAPTDRISALTTPIAYLTRLFEDPFSTSGGTFRYYSPPRPAAPPYQPGWIVWSPGPDQQYDLTMENIGQAYDPRQPVLPPLLSELTYDPTNGTTSRGDVWRVKQ
jgi:type II secretory pathway pseudopilin PulG